MNKTNYKKVLKQIKDDPNSWNQTHWHCGTSHCIAGHSQLIMGNAADDNTTRGDARAFLNINDAEADYLFECGRTLKDFNYILKNGFGNLRSMRMFRYDRFGYDEDGLDQNNKPRKGLLK